jgi:hypothetical protein
MEVTFSVATCHSGVLCIWGAPTRLDWTLLSAVALSIEAGAL